MSPDFVTTLNRHQTGSLKWDRYAGRTDRQGRTVLPLWVADMDFVSARPIREALHARVQHGVFGYTIPHAEVEEAVLDYLRRDHGYQAEREWLVFLHGCVPGLNVFAAAFGGAGAEILTCTPVYPPFLTAPGWQGGKLVTSHLRLEGSRWTFDWDDLEAKVTPQTRAFILCNPHNPVGRVFGEAELRQLGDFCLRHELVLCSDEIHCDLVFAPYRHRMTATLDPLLAARTITLQAPSKTYNTPGLSAAYAVISDPGLRAQFSRAARGFVTEINCLGYTALTAAYRHGEPWRQELLATLVANRDHLYDFTAAHLGPWLRLTQPLEATYLAWLDASAMQAHGIARPAQWLLENAGVALSDGHDFGDGRYVRLNLGCPRPTLDEALRRLAEAVTEIAG